MKLTNVVSIRLPFRNPMKLPLDVVFGLSIMFQFCVVLLGENLCTNQTLQQIVAKDIESKKQKMFYPCQSDFR